MSFWAYLKERWLTYVFIVFCLAFAFIVYKLDVAFSITNSNATYISMGVAIMLVLFIVTDYSVLNARVKKFTKYCDLNTSTGDLDDFYCPLDQIHAKSVRGIVRSFEDYKLDIHNKSQEEQDFITKWVHDVKVPISGVRLLLESHDDEWPRAVYEMLDTELASIEQATQQVLYQIKSNALYQDYKVQEVKTKKLIADTLKKYANFFGYKKINIAITGGEYTVLTDEKWSGYILSQILANAVKYTPLDGNIAIATESVGDRTTISIRNTGKGILPRDINQVFQKGYTSSEDRNGIKSTGYGLYLSKKLSDMLGHQLSVQSEVGVYAQFSLSFVENKTIHHVTKM